MSSCGNLRSWLVYGNEISSGHWPASGALGHNCGCRVDGPVNLPLNFPLGDK
jgi:hypothetical protein